MWRTGIWASSWLLERGLDSETVGAVIECWFTAMNLNRIEAAPFKEDSSSSKLLERFRFKLEGDLREKCVFWGESYDRYIMAYLEMNGKIAEISRLSRLNSPCFWKSKHHTVHSRWCRGQLLQGSAECPQHQARDQEKRNTPSRYIFKWVLRHLSALCPTRLWLC